MDMGTVLFRTARAPRGRADAELDDQPVPGSTNIIVAE